MKYNYGLHIISLVASGPSYLIKQQLEKVKENLVMIEDKDEYCDFGVLLRVQSAVESWANYCCILYRNEKSSPQIIIRSSNECTSWILFDNQLALVSFDNLRIIKMNVLPWYYWTAFCLGNDLIVVHDLGVCCFDMHANKLWEISGKNKLNDFRVTEKELICLFDDGKEGRQIL